MSKEIFSKYANQEVDQKLYAKLETLNITPRKSDNGKETPGIVFAPYIMCDHTEESLKEYNEFMTRYHTQHCCCPNCGSRNYTKTLVGYILNHEHPEDYKDKNVCHCLDCGWKGIAHELVPEKKNA